MTAATYAFTAAIVALLTTRAWQNARNEPVTRAFLGLGWSLALAWLSFALSFLPRLDAFRAGWSIGGPTAAALAWICLDLLFSERTAFSRAHRLLLTGALSLGLSMSLLHAWRYSMLPRSSPPEVVAGVTAFLLAAASLGRLLRAYRAASTPSDTTRIRWLLGTSAAGFLFAFVEWIVRTAQPIPDRTSLIFVERGLTLQGPVPPISAVLTTLAVFFLYDHILGQRFVALQSLFAHVLVACGAAVALLAVHTLALDFVTLTKFPLHSGFLLFLLSSLWFVTYPRIQQPMVHWTLRRILGPGQALDEASDTLFRTLASAESPEALCQDLADGLFATNRFDGVGIWRFDPALDGFIRVAEHGEQTITRIIALDTQTRDSLQTGKTTNLSALQGVDLLLPLHDAGALLGWIALYDAVWSDGFTLDESRRLTQIAQTAARRLHNFERLTRKAEAQRLATLGAMSAGLAHEIRNPLAGIKGAAELLLEAPHLPENSDLLGVLVTESNRLDRVVRAFLDFARPTAIKRTSVEVPSLLQHCTTLLRAEGLPPDVHLTTTFDPQIAPLRLDGDSVTQILLNLLRNALDAVADHGHIELSARAEPEQLVISVADDGPGLPDEVKSKPFTPFVTTKAQGTGLGLALSQRLANAHGGSLELMARSPRGTVAIVRLPVPPDYPGSVGASSSTPSTGATPVPGTATVPTESA